MRFSEYIRARLTAMGYDYIFGIPGSYIIDLWQEFEREPRIILARHESGAAYVADGWARATNKPGIVLTTIGPGITNVVTGVACAYKDSVPLLVLTGQAPSSTFGTGVFQETYQTDRGFNAVSLMSNITKASFELTDIRSAAALFDKALNIAVAGRKGPVHVSISMDLPARELPDYAAGCLSRSAPVQSATRRAFGRPEESVLSAIANAKRPLFLAGWGCHLSRASGLLHKISAHLSIPIISTIKGLSAISYAWDTYVGHIGAGEKSETVDFLKEYTPDVLIVIGASLSASYTAGIQDLLAHASILQIDIDHDQLGFHYAASYCIHEDAAAFLQHLDRFSESLPARKSDALTHSCHQKLCSKKYNQSDTDYGLMAASIDSLNEILPGDAILLTDAGNHWLDTLSAYRPPKPGSFYTNAGLGAMGHAIGAAIGVKLASQACKVLCITGDGSALMSGNEVSVSAELGLDTIFIIYNNSSMGRVRTHQKQVFEEAYIASDIATVDFVQWGRGLGADACRVQTAAEFIEAVSAALNRTTTSIIEVLVDKKIDPICFQAESKRRANKFS